MSSTQILLSPFYRPNVVRGHNRHYRLISGQQGFFIRLPSLEDIVCTSHLTTGSSGMYTGLGEAMMVIWIIEIKTITLSCSLNLNPLSQTVQESIEDLL